MSATEPWWTVTPAGDRPRDRLVADFVRAELTRRRAELDRLFREALGRAMGLPPAARNPDGTEVGR